MEEVKAKIQVIEVRLEEINKNIELLKNDIQKRTDINAVKVIVDETLEVKKFVTGNEVIVLVHKTLDDQDYMTKNDVIAIVKDSNVHIIKWVIGTGMSIVTLIVGFIKVFT